MAGNLPPGRHRRTRNRILRGRRNQNPSPYRRHRRSVPNPFAENESVHSDASAVSQALRIGEHSFVASSGLPASLDRLRSGLLTPRILALSATERDEVNSERGDSGSVQTTPEVTEPEDLPVGCWKTDQATRHCPKSQEDAISEYADEAIAANDLIIRNCLIENSVHTDGGKRVKKNKATRARELAMPPTAKSNANREFVAAFEQLDGSNDSVVADEQEG
ncbi:hypothetical protein FALBO_3716 [Fusarium albosuccineum]|uniref:Uncharacterized protein n=1 Tax=Fusarium albosuccineum TaxID=1237068 RepID=A0A8H4LIH2_9HYPO|nr:hypothetical protein FALBO_3716 [Fusarium albosuccineum]